MTADTVEDIAGALFRIPADPSVLIADGYGIRLNVDHGHLAVDDGIGPHRRHRTLPRAQRTVRRLIILGHTGSISLDAIRWCTDVGIALLQIDTDGRVLMLANAAGRTDGRLLRAQAAAASSEVGVAIARELLGAKLTGQAILAEGVLGQPGIADVIRSLAARLCSATTLPACRDLEAQAANAYFAAWSGRVQCRFAERDRKRVPDGWTAFGVRRSPLQRSGHSPRNAADPVNALLNFGYALAEAECRLAALAVGLDPGLGILHTDQKARDSLALDLLEPLRLVVEHHTLRLLSGRIFRAADFAETRDGRCRLLPPITHEFAALLLSELARAIAKPAEAVAHALAGSSPGKIELRTPLSRANTTNAQLPGQRGSNRQPRSTASPRKTCHQCGVELYGSARKLCPACWPVMRAEYMRQLGIARAKPAKPVKPAVEEVSGGWSLAGYQTQILPGLAQVPLMEIERATGLSNPTCSRLRRGLQVPNPKHWAALAHLVGCRRAEGGGSGTWGRMPI